MAGKPRKAPNSLAGHRQKRGPVTAKKEPESPAPEAAERALTVVENEDGEEARTVPAFPSGLLKRSREIWQRYWNSELSDHIDREGGLYRAERWIRHVDELERAWREYRRQRFVVGSMGQTRLSHAWKVIQDCEALVAKTEEVLGMTPLARARLGLTLGAEASTLMDLNRRMNEPDEKRGVRRAPPQVIDGEFRPL